MDGLRTLVFAMRSMNEEALRNFYKEFEEASVELAKRDRL
jgi:hypothetical protein